MRGVIFQEEQICIHCLNTGFAFCVIVGRKRFGILVHLEKQAGFHLITTILAIAKNKYNLTILALDDFCLIAAIAAIGEKVT